MVKLVERSFGIQLKFLKYFGCYPPSNYRIFYQIYSYFIYFCYVAAIPILATVDLVTDNDINLSKVSENAFMICQLGGFVFKVYPFLAKSDAVAKNIYTIESSLFTNYYQKQSYIMDECVYICNRNFLLFLSFCVCTLFTWGVSPFFETEPRLPLNIWLPFELKPDTGVFYCFYILVFVAVSYGGFMNATIDPLIAGLLCHAAYQIKLLKDTLQCLHNYIDEEIDNSTRNKEHMDYNQRDELIYSKIRSCIIHHNAILEFTKDIEDLYSPVTFWQLIASIIVVCISCLQLTMVELFTFSFFAMFIFLITMLTEIYFYCYYGTFLFHEANTLSTAVYNGQWYDYDLQSQKALIILMERCQIPVVLKAGKILDLSLETFTSVLRKAYSLFAVLKNN